MSCKRSVSTLLALALVISLLALDHPVAHARHVKDSSISSTGDSSSIKKGLQGVRKLDVGKTKKVKTVEVKATKGKGAQQSFGSNIGNGEIPSVESDNVVVVERRGPTPHPKKHN